MGFVGQNRWDLKLPMTPLVRRALLEVAEHLREMLAGATA